MTPSELTQMGVLAALAGSEKGLAQQEMESILSKADQSKSAAADAAQSLCNSNLVTRHQDVFRIASSGIRKLLELHAAIDEALDPSSASRSLPECPSVPWLTTVRTNWIDALSINYAVDMKALAKLIPAPLEPEPHKGRAWVQVLVSSLRDIRPQGTPALFGVCFYQVTYRAAVRYRSRDGTWSRGGYFIRSDTNHQVMRAVGNALKEFKFHDFGAAKMVMVRHGTKLNIGIEPDSSRPNGKIVGVLDTRPLAGPPKGSVWASLQELKEPLVECYDAYAPDKESGFMYILTIDRDPWKEQFISTGEIYCEYMDRGPLGNGRSRLDSVLHFADCNYRWRPLRRQRLVEINRTERS